MNKKKSYAHTREGLQDMLTLQFIFLKGCSEGEKIQPSFYFFGMILIGNPSDGMSLGFLLKLVSAHNFHVN